MFKCNCYVKQTERVNEKGFLMDGIMLFSIKSPQCAWKKKKKKMKTPKTTHNDALGKKKKKKKKKKKTHNDVLGGRKKIKKKINKKKKK